LPKDPPADRFDTQKSEKKAAVTYFGSIFLSRSNVRCGNKLLWIQQISSLRVIRIFGT
jgi:hypothetical protein